MNDRELQEFGTFLTGAVEHWKKKRDRAFEKFRLDKERVYRQQDFLGLPKPCLLPVCYVDAYLCILGALEEYSQEWTAKRRERARARLARVRRLRERRSCRGRILAFLRRLSGSQRNPALDSGSVATEEGG